MVLVSLELLHLYERWLSVLRLLHDWLEVGKMLCLGPLLLVSKHCLNEERLTRSILFRITMSIVASLQL